MWNFTWALHNGSNFHTFLYGVQVRLRTCHQIFFTNLIKQFGIAIPESSPRQQQTTSDLSTTLPRYWLPIFAWYYVYSFQKSHFAWKDTVGMRGAPTRWIFLRKNFFHIKLNFLVCPSNPCHAIASFGKFSLGKFSPFLASN